MKYFRIVMVVIVMVTILVGCSDECSMNGTIEVYNARQTDYVDGKYEYTLDEEPLFTIDDIASYDWETNEIIFTDDFNDILENRDDEIVDTIGGLVKLRTASQDKFYLFVDGVKIYEGHYEQTSSSSFHSLGVVMMSVEGGVRIYFGGVYNSSADANTGEEIKELVTIDLRNDERVKEVLESHCVLND